MQEHKQVSKQNLIVRLISGGQDVDDWKEFMNQVHKLEFHPVCCKEMSKRMYIIYDILISFMLRRDGGDAIIVVLKQLMIKYATPEAGYYKILPEYVKKELMKWDVDSNQEWKPIPMWDHDVELE